MQVKQQLRVLSEIYLLAVPSNTRIRDLEASLPPYQGRGAPRKVPFMRVDKWVASLSDKDWRRIEVRDGEKGPLVLEIVKRRVVAKTEHSREKSTEELLVVTRYRDENRQMKYDYHLSNATAETSLAELARVSKAEHLVEDCLKRAKSQAGLSDYETRTWQGWYHHQILSLVATWFLICEARRGKKIHTGNHGSIGPYVIGYPAASSLRSSTPALGNSHSSTKEHTKRASPILSLQEA